MGNAIIRPAEERDAGAVAEIYAPHVDGGVASFELMPPDAGEMAQRIATTGASHAWLVCETPESGVVGYVYAGPHNPRAAYQWSVNVSVYIGAAHHRKGLGRALYTSLFALLRLQGFYNAMAGITLPNAGSVGLHEGMGFRLVGVYPKVGFKYGAWWDVGWWSMPLREKPSGAPVPPLDAAGVRKMAGWREALEAGCGGA